MARKEFLVVPSDCDDSPPGYSCRKDTEAPGDTPSRHELPTEIIHLWKRVWQGLYEVDSDDGIYQQRTEVGQAIPRSFSEFGTKNGIASLRMFDNTPLPILKSVVEGLKAYESEIANIKQLYSILGEAQLMLGLLLVLKDVGVQKMNERFWRLLNP
ncbi:hypothetical protein N7486_006486 [Penicillium sp. IBT 16267x]|nr:hypothetical protein N7486_006486 [Penicillium sp. IBT 16267x]